MANLHLSALLGSAFAMPGPAEKVCTGTAEAMLFEQFISPKPDVLDSSSHPTLLPKSGLGDAASVIALGIKAPIRGGDTKAAAERPPNPLDGSTDVPPPGGRAPAGGHPEPKGTDEIDSTVPTPSQDSGNGTVGSDTKEPHHHATLPKQDRGPTAPDGTVQIAPAAMVAVPAPQLGAVPSEPQPSAAPGRRNAPSVGAMASSAVAVAAALPATTVPPAAIVPPDVDAPAAPGSAPEKQAASNPAAQAICDPATVAQAEAGAEAIPEPSIADGDPPVTVKPEPDSTPGACLQEAVESELDSGGKPQPTERSKPNAAAAAGHALVARPSTNPKLASTAGNTTAEANPLPDDGAATESAPPPGVKAPGATLESGIGSAGKHRDASDRRDPAITAGGVGWTDAKTDFSIILNPLTGQAAAPVAPTAAAHGVSAPALTPAAPAALPSPQAIAMAGVPIAGLPFQIAARAKDGQNRFEIRLDPPELGRIDVHLHVDRDGQVTSHVVVDRADTLDLLRRDAADLQRSLQQAGLKTTDNGLQFSLRDQSLANYSGRQQNNGPVLQTIIPDRDVAMIPEIATRGYLRAGLGSGLDIRV